MAEIVILQPKRKTMGIKRKFPKADPGDDVTSLMEPREDGGKEWKYRGKLHRGGDLPAMETPDFSAWYRHGLMHRENGAAYISADGKEQRYLKMGKKHREGGQPAVYRRDGGLEWFENDQRHCENGPAIINPNGTQEFWMRGKKLSLEEFLQHQMVVQQKLTVKKPIRLKRAPT